MSVGMNISFVRERYERMSDDELMDQVSRNAGGLTAEAMAIVKEEIGKRGLHTGFFAALDVQNKEMSLQEMDDYYNLVMQMNCPFCGNNTSQLNGTQTAEVVSAVLFTEYKKRIYVGCPTCLHKLNNTALIKTMALGWWALPWGIFRSLQAIVVNFNNKGKIRSTGPNKFLKTYVQSNIGQIEAYRHHPEDMKIVLRKYLE